MDFAIVTLYNSDLAQRIAQACGTPLHVAETHRFTDGEIAVTLSKDIDVAGKKVFMLHATRLSVHEHIMQAILLAHELRNAHVGEIVGIFPYFAYARHDKSSTVGGIAPVAAIIQILESVGYTSFVTIDIHAPHNVLPLFSVPVQNINPAAVIAQQIKERHNEHDFCLVAPDAGAAELASEVALLLGVPTLFFNKKRTNSNLTFTGTQLHKKHTKAIVVDDIIDSGATAIGVCTELKAMGFALVEGYFMHPVLSGDAIARIAISHYDVIYVSNSIDLPTTSAKIKTFDISAVIERALHAK